jgi:thiaminase/transcriptional activator TenA
MTPLHENLWSENDDLARSIRRHRFVRALGDGSLEPEVFRRYVAQDAFFLLAYARGYSLAAAHSKCLEDLQAFHRLLGGALEELNLHWGYASELGIELEGVEPYPETLAYTDFLAATAWRGNLGELLAAMTPCLRLYSFLGAELARGGIPEHRYRAWIETYSSGDFAALTRKLEALLDRHAGRTEEIHHAYRYAMRCELDFFSAPYREDGGGTGGGGNAGVAQ